MTRRRTISTKTRKAIFEANEGTCCYCGGKIQPTEAFIIEHEIPLELGGSDDPKDLKVTHLKCAKDKTKKDIADISRAKRREAKHKGFSQPKRMIQSAGFAKTKKAPLIDKSQLKYGVK